VFLLLAVVPVFGQDPQYRVVARNPVALPLPDRSTVPANGRYEIVQSAVLRSRAFMLDRFTGSVMELVSGGANGLRWELMRVVGRDSTIAPKTPRFQIVFLSNPLESMFLLDCETGRSWEFTAEKPEYVGKWLPTPLDVPIGAQYWPEFSATTEKNAAKKSVPTRRYNPATGKSEPIEPMKQIEKPGK
jgi:hypothetical protein